ncbi:hypothetical protein [Peribacillus simplex]|uniref:hypothetical protein n=1 Tax=Peribacillus simplex TaxID=1478 RepID=UPI0015C2CF3C|nr:hypothetical protein [Peribacillus simplex]
MNLLNITLRNVQRNFRVYTIYLFAMITGVMIHFTTSSLVKLHNLHNFISPLR